MQLKVCTFVQIYNLILQEGCLCITTILRIIPIAQTNMVCTGNEDTLSIPYHSADIVALLETLLVIIAMTSLLGAKVTIIIVLNVASSPIAAWHLVFQGICEKMAVLE